MGMDAKRYTSVVHTGYINDLLLNNPLYTSLVIFTTRCHGTKAYASVDFFYNIKQENLRQQK